MVAAPRSSTASRPAAATPASNTTTFSTPATDATVEHGPEGHT